MYVSTEVDLLKALLNLRPELLDPMTEETAQALSMASGPYAYVGYHFTLGVVGEKPQAETEVIHYGDGGGIINRFKGSRIESPSGSGSVNIFQGADLIASLVLAEGESVAVVQS